MQKCIFLIKFSAFPPIRSCEAGLAQQLQQYDSANGLATHLAGIRISGFGSNVVVITRPRCGHQASDTRAPHGMSFGVQSGTLAAKEPGGTLTVSQRRTWKMRHVYSHAPEEQSDG